MAFPDAYVQICYKLTDHCLSEPILAQFNFPLAFPLF